jgi:hypothetical protein
LRVEAWNTVDASISVNLGRRAPELGKYARLVLNVSNVFDEEPPRVSRNTGSFPTFWDPTNASITGRFASVELVVGW